MSVNGRFQFRFPGLLGLTLLAVGLFCPASVILGGSKDLAVPFDFSLNAVDGGVEVRFFQLAFPDDDHRPALRLQLAPDFLVACLVTGNLGCPEIGVRFRCRVVLTSFVAVPETSMDKDNGLILWEDDVGRAWKLADILPVAEPQAP